MSSKPLWLTYAWADDEAGDFSYLAQELRRGGVPVVYDKIALVPGKRLWEQISERISKAEISGWAFLVTPKSLQSEACKEELEYAVNRALMNRDFPLIALASDVSFRDLPAPLQVRLGVNLTSPDWVEQVRAGVEGRAPARSAAPTSEWKVATHRNYGGRAGITAFEVRPRFGEARYWRWAYPKSGPTPVSWGNGPAGGGGLSSVMTEVIEGEADLFGETHAIRGCGARLSPSTSAYIAFHGRLPKRVAFGVAKGPWDVPERWETWNPE